MDIIQNALAEGAIVLTANARAARATRLAYAEQQQSGGREVWVSPSIFDWDSWLHTLWSNGLLADPKAPLLLTPLQEHALWKRVQREDARLVVSSDGLASLAQSAYTLLSDYELHDARKATWFEIDTEHFRKWASAFDQLCRDRRWASGSTLASQISLAAQSKTLALPKKILLVGFDRFSPAQEHLLRSFRDAGTQIETAEPPPLEDSVHTLLCADDLRDELLTCAQWCRAQLENDPAKHIGVIAPDVSRIRAEAERTFWAALMPESLDLAFDATSVPFEFSLGEPLSTVPVVKAALVLMHWLVKPLPEEEITWLLLSGFFNEDHSETLALAQFDFKQRDSGLLSPETSLSACIRSLQHNAHARTSSLAHRLRALLQTAEEHRVSTQTGTYSYWCELVEKFLHLAGWPGYRRPDSIQFQAQKRWQHLLDEIALLDFAENGVSFRAFLSTLERQANETIFTAESHNAPIQILGALESAGQTFDALWFLGVDDSQWPASGRPHSFLPLSLQRSAHMPRSSSAVDAELARIVTVRIANSAPECIFSYARQNKEGELRASPILTAVFGHEKPAVSSSEFRKQWEITQPTASGSSLEIIPIQPEAIPWPVDRAAGGADVLKEQSACPFQAFAKRRLATRPLNRTEWGLNAAERGNILHRILENIWSPETPEPFRMVSLDDLKNKITAGQLDTILKYHIAGAFQAYRREQAQDPWTQAYFESEQRRLLIRLRVWMLCEDRREPFMVEAREQRLQDVSVGELKLNLRADRIDALPDGSHLLIDYKTSNISAADWQGDRPDEPQLPLYAVYGNVENVSGLLFAQIRAGKTEFVGRVADAQQQLQANLSASNALVNQPYDDSMRDGWQDALMHLADEFLHGEALVEPTHGAETCKYCPLPGLCRIAEIGQLTADEDEGENGNG